MALFARFFNACRIIFTAVVKLKKNSYVYDLKKDVFNTFVLLTKSYEE